jgi:hypothetical protein
MLVPIPSPLSKKKKGTKKKKILTHPLLLAIESDIFIIRTEEREI